MIVHYTSHFIKSFKNLPKPIQKLAIEQTHDSWCQVHF